ncbi:MAG: hypothetical protein AB2A00_27815 [Myxococcota bacterium]
MWAAPLLLALLHTVPDGGTPSSPDRSSPPVRIRVAPTAFGLAGEVSSGGAAAMVAAELNRRGHQGITEEMISIHLQMALERQSLGCSGAECDLRLFRALDFDVLVLLTVEDRRDGAFLRLDLLIPPTLVEVGSVRQRLHPPTYATLGKALPALLDTLLPTMRSPPEQLARVKPLPFKELVVGFTPSRAQERPSLLLPVTPRYPHHRYFTGPGGLMVAYGSSQSGNPEVFAGDAATLQVQHVVEARPAGSAVVVQLADPVVRDRGTAVLRLEGGNASVDCGDETVPLEPVPEGERLTSLRRASKVRAEWAWRPVLLAHDENGVTYFVDASTSSPRHRVWIGQGGTYYSLEGLALLSGADVTAFFGPTGTLAVSPAHVGVVWTRGRTYAPLQYVPASNMDRVIFAKDGPYAGHLPSTICGQWRVLH